ncbi:MAG: DNA repair protein RecN [Rubrivivax sp.]
MLRRLSLRDVAIVAALEIELADGFTVLTGETGAGKSILVDALQLALGGRGDAAVVREGASRAEVGAEFDAPAALASWLDANGFASEEGGTLLLRRTIDVQGRSRAWINGSPATLAQLREAAERLVEIHGQHAWQSLTRPAAVRALLDAEAGLDGRGGPLEAMHRAWRAWREALAALAQARAQRDGALRERERLAWQIAELDKLAPGVDEWEALNTEHSRLAHGQALLDAVHAAIAALAEDEGNAGAALARAGSALRDVLAYDPDLRGVADLLDNAAAQVEDAAHTLGSCVGRREPDPERLAELDARLAAWVGLARRHRRTPAELPAWLARCKEELHALDAAADLEALERSVGDAERRWHAAAGVVSQGRRRAAATLADAVSAAMQSLGMAGGRFEVALLAQSEPQAFGAENVELRVAGHAGSAPRPLAKVASGGELSRLALAIAVCASGRAECADPADGIAGAADGAAGADGADQADQADQAVPTLVFDEIDAGIGGRVADNVGRLMKQLGARVQVLAVTHLAQVAACADHHFVVAKALHAGRTLAGVTPVDGAARVAELARMLGGERPSGTAHAEAMLASGGAGSGTGDRR